MRKRYALVRTYCQHCEQPFEIERYLLGEQQFCSRSCHYAALTVPIEVRFWQKVIKADTADCWNWIGAKIKGYGVIKHGGANVFAHRISYQLHTGEPTALVLHKCDNPSCVNPAHLFLGTHQDNTNDMLSKGRENPPIGERQGNHKLTEQQVRLIFADVGTHRAIAERFSVSQSIVSLIKNRKRWNHLW